MGLLPTGLARKVLGDNAFLQCLISTDILEKDVVLASISGDVDFVQHIGRLLHLQRSSIDNRNEAHLPLIYEARKMDRGVC
jgi:hypothetical protein